MSADGPAIILILSIYIAYRRFYYTIKIILFEQKAFIARCHYYMRVIYCAYTSP